MRSSFKTIVLTATLLGPIFGWLAALLLVMFYELVDSQGTTSQLSHDFPEIALSYVVGSYPLLGLQSFANGLVFYSIGRDRSTLPVWSIVPVVAVVFVVGAFFTVVALVDEQGPVHGFSLQFVVGILLVHVVLGLGSWLVVRRFWKVECV
jgi:hypothetical protein